MSPVKKELKVTIDPTRDANKKQVETDNPGPGQYKVILDRKFNKSNLFKTGIQDRFGSVKFKKA